MCRVLYILALIVSFSVQATENRKNDCEIFTNKNVDIFELDINTSFDGNVNFLLSKERNKYYLIVNASKDILYKDRIELNKKQLALISKKFRIALNYDTKQDIQGLDGSTWCFTPNIISKSTKMCFWSPDYKAAERGLDGLHELGESLWGHTDLDKKGFKLY